MTKIKSLNTLIATAAGDLISDDVMAKLTERRQQLGELWGFVPTLDQVVLHLLRVPSTVTTKLVEGIDKPKSFASLPLEEQNRGRPLARELAMEWMRKGEKISAIKELRAHLDMPLKDAKDFVEREWSHLLPKRT